VQAASELEKPLRVRLATLFHDLGKPGGAEDHAAAGAEITDAVILRLRYPNELRHRVVRIVRFHPFHLRSGDDLEARHLLAQHGEGLVLDLLDHWDADLRGRDDTPRTREKLAQAAHFRHIVERERSSPHKLSDLAVDGTDLIELGYHPGPALGRTLDELLDAVVEDPSLNRRELLLKRAQRLLVE
jgi:tRNA nucleotidyltransferase (CCA-adding enzyme)